MHIRITFNDGASEQVAVGLEGGALSAGQGWIPGHTVAEPGLCSFGSDYFAAALDEGGLRHGEVQPGEADIDPDTGRPGFQGFRWEVVGSEADLCRDKLRQWISRLGPGFNTDRKGADYLHSGLLRVLTDSEARQYDQDMQCCFFYLADVAQETLSLTADAGDEPGRSPAP